MRLKPYVKPAAFFAAALALIAFAIAHHVAIWNKCRSMHSFGYCMWLVSRQ